MADGQLAQRAPRPLWVAAEQLADCFRLALLEDLVTTLRRQGSATAPAATALWLNAIADHRPGPEVSASMTMLWQAYLRYGQYDFHRLGGPVVVRPVFADAFGIGDLIVGTTLIDVKMVQDPFQDMLMWLWQLLGYAFADLRDERGIRRAGIYHGCDALLIDWDLADLLAHLGADVVDLTIWRTSSEKSSGPSDSASLNVKNHRDPLGEARGFASLRTAALRAPLRDSRLRP